MIDKRLSPLLATLAGAAALLLSLGAACAADTKGDAKQGDLNKPAVLVNGKAITNRDVEAFAAAMSAQGGRPIPRDEVLNTLIDRELLYQEAIAKHYDKRPDVVLEIENQRRSLLANVSVSEMLRAKPATEEELRKIYQDRIASQKLSEYKARHILVKSEGEAKDIIDQLDKGADFSALAKSKSTDTASGANGGDLGWFNSNQMVPEFSKATAALEKGKYTKTPVQSQFGWHVIVLDDVRPVTPPSFDDMKDRIEGAAQNQRLGEYLLGLRKKAKIEKK